MLFVDAFETDLRNSARGSIDLSSDQIDSQASGMGGSEKVPTVILREDTPIGSFYIGVAEAVWEIDGSSFYLMKDTFDIRMSVAFVSEIRVFSDGVSSEAVLLHQRETRRS